MTSSNLHALLSATREATLVKKRGRVRAVAGLVIEADGPEVGIGSLCEIFPDGGGAPVPAEVVAVRDGVITLMSYGSIRDLAAGCEVVSSGARGFVGVGPALLGRVINGFGEPLDEGPALVGLGRAPLEAAPLNPLTRPRIGRVLETGVRVIDSLLTLGEGQRVGIFSGSGVGKTTLLGMMARHVKADVNVIALIGERSREVREFIDTQLDDEARARSVVVVASADQPALLRLRAAHAALAIAEYFREQGRHALLTMDSVTRYAMARREVGLAAGEPPTARGYTPSVFAELPRLVERCGTHASGGAISGLFTVLVDGDDLDEPISDALRATLDGHIVLSRRFAQAAHYPAIDVLKSASRVMPKLLSGDERELVARVVRAMALIDRNRQIIDLGAYVAGANPALDVALEIAPALDAFLMQAEGGAGRDEALRQLRLIAQRLS